MDFKGAVLKPGQPRLVTKPTEAKIPNWLNLPSELMVSIMHRIHWLDVLLLLNVKEVCKSWHQLSKDPSIWRVIKFEKCIMVDELMKKKGMPTFLELLKSKREATFAEERYAIENAFDLHYKISNGYAMNKVLQEIVMHVIDLSCGQLLDLCVQNFGSDHLFQYIYQRSSQLRRLRLKNCVVCYDDLLIPDKDISLKGLIQMINNFPLLEELQLPFNTSWISGEDIEVVGGGCPHLKSFTLYQEYDWTSECDKQALAIAKTMPGLRRLKLFGNKMTNSGLMAILNNCHYLEYLDLRECFNIGEVLEPDYYVLVLEPDLVTKLRQQIKHVRFPQDGIW